MNATKFTLFDFNGKPTDYYEVASLPSNLTATPAKSIPVPSHLILDIDRSGSMCGDINALKDMVIKLLTITEYQQSTMLVSLISYSSHGDVTLHFERIPVTEIMKTNSPYIQKVKSIRATCMTGMSQSLKLAQTIIKPNELSCIVLHSDGYANDPSPSQETKSVMETCAELAKMNVFVNTVAYRESSDFQFLNRIANAVSGKCTLASTSKEVYDAMFDTSQVLNKQSVPVMTFPIGQADYQIFVSKTACRVNGTSDDLKVTGLSPSDDGTLYQYRKLTVDQYKQSSCAADQSADTVYAFAIGQLAEGNLNRAKFALVSTQNLSLAKKHARALTNPQLAALTNDLKSTLFRLMPKDTTNSVINLGGQTSILKLVQLLEENRDAISINLKALNQNYKRRDIKRIPGIRKEDGSLEKPWIDTEYLDTGEFVKVGSFDINRNNATINMLVNRPVRLIKVADRKPISEVAGVVINNLNSFNTFTIVSDGDINVSELKIKISTEKAFKTLKEAKVLDAANFDFKAEYSLRLQDLPVVDYNSTADVSTLGETFDKIARARILASIFGAIAKEESDKFSKEQVEELKKHYLSKNLYLNFPTTNEYADLKTALSNGSVDIRVSYKVDIGNEKILNLGGLHSANKFLDRMFEAYNKSTNEALEETKFDSFFEPSVSYRLKKLSAKVKVTAIDDLMKPIFADFLGIQSNGEVNRILAEVTANSPTKTGVLLKDILKGGVASIISIKKQVDDYIEGLYRKNIIPVTFYIGSTGLMLDGIATKAETADQIQAALPNIKMGKDEKEGSFFRVGKSIISIYASNEYYSTGRNATTTTVAMPTSDSIPQTTPVAVPSF